MSYLFGDTDRAALRLQVLADVFAESTRAFLQDVVKMPPRLVLDLGCGPGYTTHLLAQTTRCVEAVGLDSSEHFITLADRTENEHVWFLGHDVTRVPFPTEPGDLLFCRMLLTHLRAPQTIIERWATQMRPDGLLLLEEVEWIQTDQPLFRTYLGIVAAMLEEQRNQLYIGSQLDAMQPGDLGCQMSRVYRLPVFTKQAATMFSLNIQTWKDQPFIRQHYAIGTIKQLEENLRALAETSTSEGEIEWGMRQIAYAPL